MISRPFRAIKDGVRDTRSGDLFTLSQTAGSLAELLNYAYREGAREAAPGDFPFSPSIPDPPWKGRDPAKARGDKTAVSLYGVLPLSLLGRSWTTVDGAEEAGLLSASEAATAREMGVTKCRIFSTGGPTQVNRLQEHAAGQITADAEANPKIVIEPEGASDQETRERLRAAAKTHFYTQTPDWPKTLAWSEREIQRIKRELAEDGLYMDVSGKCFVLKDQSPRDRELGAALTTSWRQRTAAWFKRVLGLDQ